MAGSDLALFLRHVKGLQPLDCQLVGHIAFIRGCKLCILIVSFRGPVTVYSFAFVNSRAGSIELSAQVHSTTVTHSQGPSVFSIGGRHL